MRLIIPSLVGGANTVVNVPTERSVSINMSEGRGRPFSEQPTSIQQMLTSEQSRAQLDREEKTALDWFLSAEKRALVVGVGKYDDPRVTQLENSTGDATAVAASLGEFINRDNINLYKNVKYYEMQMVLNRMKIEAGRSDILYFYFSGHYVNVGRRLFLLCGDSDEHVDATAVSFDKIKESSLGSRAQQILIFLDITPEGGAAHTGLQHDSINRPAISTLDIADRQIGIIAGGQNGWRSTYLGHSIFTYFLLRGLRGDAARNGVVTFGGLASYVQEALIRETLGNVMPVSIVRRTSVSDLVVAVR